MRMPAADAATPSWPGEEGDLEVAMAEIQAVIRKHNVAGAVALTTTKGGFASFAFPAWSTYQVEDGNLKASFIAKDPERSEASGALLMKLSHMTMAILGNALIRAVKDIEPKLARGGPRIQVTAQMPGGPAPGLPR